MLFYSQESVWILAFIINRLITVHKLTSTPFISANVLDEFITHSMYETKQPRNCQKDTALSEAIT